MLTMETRQEERNKELDILLRAANEYLTDALFRVAGLGQKTSNIGADLHSGENQRGGRKMKEQYVGKYVIVRETAPAYMRARFWNRTEKRRCGEMCGTCGIGMARHQCCSWQRLGR